MSSNRHLIAASVLFTVVLALWYMSAGVETVDVDSAPLAPSSHESAAPTPTTATDSVSAPLAETPPPAALPMDTQERRASPIPAQKLAPSRETVRNEVAANPHQPPRSMLKFTVELYDKRMEALQSETKAKAFLQELGACVANQESALDSQGMCLVNAQYVRDRYPNFGRDVEDMEKQASPDAVRFARGFRL